MRWLGLAKRCMEIAGNHVEKRMSFGQTLAQHEGVQWMIGQVARVQVGRLLTMNAAWKLDQGNGAKTEISMAKIHVAEPQDTATDKALPLFGHQRLLQGYPGGLESLFAIAPPGAFGGWSQQRFTRWSCRRPILTRGTELLSLDSCHRVGSATRTP